MAGARIFLLSPAFCGGRRSAILLREESEVPIARRLQAGTLPLGEAFSFLSGLYFRGKLAYGGAFGRARGDVAPMLVITPTRGLMDPRTLIDAGVIREFAAGDVALDSASYLEPLDRDLALLESRLGRGASVVLLGSVATGKYVDTLIAVFGARLVFPPTFVGRGDMSRGGLLLRSARSGDELDYAPIQGAVLRGKRPPRLPRLRVRAAQS
jgi:hypothetical protein